MNILIDHLAALVATAVGAFILLYVFPYKPR